MGKIVEGLPIELNSCRTSKAAHRSVHVLLSDANISVGSRILFNLVSSSQASHELPFLALIHSFKLSLLSQGVIYLPVERVEYLALRHLTHDSLAQDFRLESLMDYFQGITDQII